MNHRHYKVIVADFHQETNGFNPNPWTLEHFKRDTLLFGEEIISQYGTSSGRVLCGILEEAQKRNAEIIPVCAMRATSGGAVEHPVVEQFLNALLTAYEANRDADAFILSLHGATQSTREDDVCGYILSRLREVADKDMIISVGCDLHANITMRCLENADYICGFQTYPHIDQKETGARAARLAFDKLDTGRTTYLARAWLPMIVPASGYSTNASPLREVVQHAHQLVADGLLRDFTMFHMQPWLDVDPAGSTVITIADDPDTAAKCARALATMVLQHRDSFWPELLSPDEVIDVALANQTGKPVVLVDFADSPGAGATGESAAVLRHLDARNYPVSAALVVGDVAAVAQAHAVGEGASAVFSLGSDPEHPEGFLVTAQVLRLCDGVFYQEGPVGPGQRRNMGRVAVLRVKNADIVVCEHTCGTSDLQAFRHFGIEPTEYRLVAVKANVSLRAAYTPISAEICMTDTPGASAAQLQRLPYRKIPRSFYPFSSLENYTVEPPVVVRR